MEHVVWSARPRLRTPILVAAFTGWNDAGDAASLAVKYLGDGWDADPIASIDPEEFFEFQATRPQVRLVDGETREIVWPANDFHAAVTDGNRDVVLLLGTEPQLKWRRFCTEVLEVARALEVSQVVTLGALLADVAHNRPVSLIGTASDAELIERFHLERSRYEGPTGITGVLSHTCAREGIPAMSLWAAVPHYVGGAPSPKAALALVQRTSELVDAPVRTAALEIAAAAYEREIDQLVEDDEDLQGYVARIEELRAEEEAEEHAEGVSGERLVAEVEQFLRDRRREGDR
jgi:predicted ATP-grasp superfamily ATP-dependent carboligase